MTFKLGDKVVCIDALDSDDLLTKNKVYIMNRGEVDGFCTHIHLKEVSGHHWSSTRFRLATEEEAKQANPHIGPTFDSLDGMLEEVDAQAQDTTSASPHNLIPDCLAPWSEFSGEERVERVVAMALKWQSEQPHVDGCDISIWSLGHIANDDMQPLYLNNYGVGRLDSSVGRVVLTALNATEKSGPYCPTCEALKELEK